MSLSHILIRSYCVELEVERWFFPSRIELGVKRNPIRKEKLVVFVSALQALKRSVKIVNTHGTKQIPLQVFCIFYIASLRFKWDGDGDFNHFYSR